MNKVQGQAKHIGRIIEEIPKDVKKMKTLSHDYEKLDIGGLIKLSAEFRVVVKKCLAADKLISARIHELIPTSNVYCECAWGFFKPADMNSQLTTHQVRQLFKAGVLEMDDDNQTLYETLKGTVASADNCMDAARVLGLDVSNGVTEEIQTAVEDAHVCTIDGENGEILWVLQKTLDNPSGK